MQHVLIVVEQRGSRNFQQVHANALSMCWQIYSLIRYDCV